ncbi:MAG TPA: alkaline phosphatase family protein, partial [Dehalococcoidia bacterium]|nr:alkaline phosphatase family protein [Dehalococcoidia bacterium]
MEGVPTSVRPRLLARHRDRNFWRYDFSVPQAATEARVGYGLSGGQRHHLCVPAPSGMPRLAFASCNGTEDEAVFTQPGIRNARWAHLFGRHRAQPFHVLLHGGDQLYAD